MDTLAAIRPLLEEIKRRETPPALAPVRTYREDWEARIREWQGRLQAVKLPGRAEAACVGLLAGLYLCNDSLDRSHEAAQSAETPEGSYWHGIMHRMEPDYDNAKYWFRRVGEHAVFPRLAEAVGSRGPAGEGEPLIGRLATKAAAAEWDPFLFVDAVAAAVSGDDGAGAAWCEQVQWKEMTLLLDVSYQAAMEATAVG